MEESKRKEDPITGGVRKEAQFITHEIAPFITPRYRAQHAFEGVKLLPNMEVQRDLPNGEKAWETHMSAEEALWKPLYPSEKEKALKVKPNFEDPCLDQLKHEAGLASVFMFGVPLATFFFVQSKCSISTKVIHV